MVDWSLRFVVSTRVWPNFGVILTVHWLVGSASVNGISLFPKGLSEAQPDWIQIKMPTNNAAKHGTLEIQRDLMSDQTHFRECHNLVSGIDLV